MRTRSELAFYPSPLGLSCYHKTLNVSRYCALESLPVHRVYLTGLPLPPRVFSFSTYVDRQSLICALLFLLLSWPSLLLLWHKANVSPCVRDWQGLPMNALICSCFTSFHGFVSKLITRFICRTNTTCICSSSDYQAGLEQCIQNTCADETNDANNYQSTVCPGPFLFESGCRLFS